MLCTLQYWGCLCNPLQVQMVSVLGCVPLQNCGTVSSALCQLSCIWVCHASYVSCRVKVCMSAGNQHMHTCLCVSAYLHEHICPKTLMHACAEPQVTFPVQNAQYIMYIVKIYVCANFCSFAEILMTLIGSTGKLRPSIGEEERTSRFTPFSGGR